MDQMTQLVQRATRLEAQATAMGQDIAQLRLDLEKLESGQDGSAHPVRDGAAGCLAVAIRLAEDLGPGFSSKEPHKLSERGEEWFGQP
jgi:hypothetical protein